MIYPSPPARKKRISWDSSLDPRTGTQRSSTLPRVRRIGTPRPRSVGTRQASFQVSGMTESAIKSFEEMGLDDCEGSQVSASWGVAGRRAAPPRSLFAGPSASPSTSRIRERLATPSPTFESLSNFTFGASNGEFGGQRAAPPSLNRSSALLQGTPTSSCGSHAFPSVPFNFTFSQSTFGTSNWLTSGQRTMQDPVPSTIESSLNGSPSALFQSAPVGTHNSSATCFAFGPSNGKFGRQLPLTFRDLASARFHHSPTFEPHAPTVKSVASKGLVVGQRLQQDLSGFLGGIESPVPSHASSLEDSPALTPAIFDSPIAVRTVDAPVSRTRFRAPSQSPPLGVRTPTSDSGGLGTFGASGLEVLASITRSAPQTGSFGPDAKPRTPSNLFETGGSLRRIDQARVPAAELFAPAANGGLFPQPAPTVSTTLPQQQPPPRVLRSRDRSVRAPRLGLSSAEINSIGEAPQVVDVSSEQKPPATREELGSDKETGGRVVRKAANARGLFVDASLEEVRRAVGFQTPDDIARARNKAQLEAAPRELKNGLFHCNVNHFRPEPNHSGRDPIRVSGKRSVLQRRLTWFLFHVEVDFSED